MTVTDNPLPIDVISYARRHQCEKVILSSGNFRKEIPTSLQSESVIMSVFRCALHELSRIRRMDRGRTYTCDFSCIKEGMELAKGAISFINVGF